MFCKKCGKEIADTVKFCAFCGAPVSSEDVPVMPVIPIEPVEDEKTVSFNRQEEPDDDATVVVPGHAGNQGAEGEQEHVENVEKAMVPPPVPDNAATDFGTAAQQQTYYQPDNGQNMQSAQPEETKKSHTGIVLAILGVIAVALIVVVIFLLRGLLGSKSTVADDLFYQKNGDLSAVLNITAKEPADIEIDSIRGSYDTNKWSAILSQDGKYFYYYNKIDDDGMYGTLCRIPTDKLKKKGDNEQFIEEIDSKVNVESVEILNDASVVYKRKDGELSLYENGEVYELADSVSSYYMTDDEKYIVYTEEEDDGNYTLYCVSAAKDAKPEEIDSHVNSLLNASNSSFILYTMDYDDENYTYDVYVAGADAKPVLAAEDVYSTYGICADEKSFYYTNQKCQEMSLYSYVIDSSAESDAKQTEPVAYDYMVKVDKDKVLSEYDRSRYDTWGEFYEEQVYPYDRDWYTGLYYHYNYDDDCYYYYDDEGNQWYGNFDSDAFDEARNEYSRVAERNELREELKAETINHYYQELHFYKNGDESLTCENVDSVYTDDQRGVIYTKTDLETGEAKYPIEEVNSCSDVRYEIESGDEGDSDGDIAYYCCVNGGKETELSEFDSVSSIYVSKDGNTVVITGNYDESGCREIIAYKVSDQALGEGKSLTEEGDAVGFHDNTFYFYDDVDQDEGDLYTYAGAEPKLLAKNSLVQNMFIGDDGAVIGYSDWDSDDYTGELNIYGKDGKGERIAKDVSEFRYLGSGTYLYLQDGDIYYLNKKGEENRLARNVDVFWYPNQMNGYFVYD